MYEYVCVAVYVWGAKSLNFTYPGNFNSKSAADSMVGAIRFSGILVVKFRLILSAERGSWSLSWLAPVWDGCGDNVEVGRWANTKLDHNGSRSNEEITRLFTTRHNIVLIFNFLVCHQFVPVPRKMENNVSRKRGKNKITVSPFCTYIYIFFA